MRLPRDLSGRELVAALCRRWEYEFVVQQGSHLILQTKKPGHHRLSVPAHDALRIGP